MDERLHFLINGCMRRSIYVDKIAIMLISCLLTLTRFAPDSARPSDFEFLRVIGKGSFGKVFLAHHRAEGSSYAIKVLQKRMIVQRNETKHIMSERNVLLRNLHHPFLVGLHYSFQTKDKLYFVLDYVSGGEVRREKGHYALLETQMLYRAVECCFLPKFH